MKVLILLVIGILQAQSKTANAVTPVAPTSSNEVVEEALTPLDAMRALTDVQIRRIKNMIVNRQVNQDTAYEELQRLQKNLRGEK